MTTADKRYSMVAVPHDDDECEKGLQINSNGNPITPHDFM